MSARGRKPVAGAAVKQQGEPAMGMARAGISAPGLMNILLFSYPEGA